MITEPFFLFFARTVRLDIPTSAASPPMPARSESHRILCAYLASPSSGGGGAVAAGAGFGRFFEPEPCGAIYRYRQAAVSAGEPKHVGGARGMHSELVRGPGWHSRASLVKF